MKLLRYVRFLAPLALGLALFSASAAPASAAVIPTQGSATTTITNLVFNDDGTISIDAVESGTLSKIGAFTAQFSYVATPAPTGLVLVGTGTITTAKGDKLFVKARILEIGADYPFTVSGLLTITGGTGRYAGATGALYVSGIDDVSLTDTLQIQGAVITAH
jgi:hypothetical protein